MSADNGVYVLETDGPEFRVKEIMAVEDLWWSRERAKDDATPEEALQNAREVYKTCEVFTEKSLAYLYAAELYESLDICEYGISPIKMSGKF